LYVDPLLISIMPFMPFMRLHTHELTGNCLPGCRRLRLLHLTAKYVGDVGGVAAGSKQADKQEREEGRR
jgi:hypothetical protein